MTRRWWIVLAAGGVGLILAATAVPGQITAWTEESDLARTHITYARQQCPDTVCPAYQVDVYGDGKVIYQGISHVAVTGAWIYHLPRKDVADWLTDFRTSGFWNRPNLPTPVAGEGSCRVVISSKHRNATNGCYDAVGNDKMTLETPRIAPEITQMDVVLHLDDLVYGPKTATERGEKPITGMLKPYHVKRPWGK